MARYQHPNPLDLMFFAADAALRRMGLPGSHAHVHVELAGELDLPKFRSTVAALHRRYPVLAARQCLELATGRPRWRLDAPKPNLERVVRLHRVEPATEARLHEQLNTLFTLPVDATTQPPMQFHVFRGLARGDVLVLRWPHALLDGRGALMLLDELDRLWSVDAGTDVDAVRSAGDELRNDYPALLDDRSVLDRLKLIAPRKSVTRRRGKPVVRLASASAMRPAGPLRFIVRNLTAEQTRAVRAHAAALEPTARLSDFIRASALRAMGASLPEPPPPNAVYTMLSYLDGRRQRPGAVCWNLTAAVPLTVPATIVEDRARVATLLRAQMTAHLADRTALRHYATMWLMTRPPTAYVAALIRAGLGGGARGERPVLARLLPSLPLGILGPSERGLARLCGVPVHNYHAFRTVLPEHGFALDVNMTAERLNVSGVCLTAQVTVETLAALMDRFVANLLEAC